MPRLGMESYPLCHRTSAYRREDTRVLIFRLGLYPRPLHSQAAVLVLRIVHRVLGSQ